VNLKPSYINCGSVEAEPSSSYKTCQLILHTNVRRSDRLAPGFYSGLTEDIFIRFRLDCQELKNSMPPQQF
jgi:hypothetical protein